MKKFIALLLALTLVLGLTACAETTQESTTNDIYATQGGEVTLPEGMETSKRFNSQIENGTLYIDYNNILLRNTGYFQTEGDTITLTANATTDSPGLHEFKAGLWELTNDGMTQYVKGCTLYFTTGGDCYTGTFSGLDPSVRYKITISYDSGSYYITGTMKVEGLANAEVASDDGEAGGAEAVA